MGQREDVAILITAALRGCCQQGEGAVLLISGHYSSPSHSILHIGAAGRKGKAAGSNPNPLLAPAPRYNVTSYHVSVFMRLISFPRLRGLI